MCRISLDILDRQSFVINDGKRTNFVYAYTNFPVKDDASEITYA